MFSFLSTDKKWPQIEQKLIVDIKKLLSADTEKFCI